MSTHKSKRRTADDEDTEYDSSEDTAFQDDDAISNSSSDESEPAEKKDVGGKDLDSGDEVTITKQRKRKDSNVDDLILTRAQKRAKAEEQKNATKAAPVLDKSEDLDVIWARLNEKSATEAAQSIPTGSIGSDMIKIKRTYEFAGQIITEEKEVEKDSAEAKVYLSSLHTPSSANDASQAKPAIRRPMKRKSNLGEMAKGHKPVKLNVLEKSRLDWAGFVDKEGIHDDLKRHNKDGYVERQEFLRRTR